MLKSLYQYVSVVCGLNTNRVKEMSAQSGFAVSFTGKVFGVCEADPNYTGTSGNVTVLINLA
jgi:hypothetical protein